MIEICSRDLAFFEFKNKSFPIFEQIFRYITRGGLLDMENLADFIRANTGDITFQVSKILNLNNF